MLDIEEQSGVVVIRLRHGKVNALDLELLRAITSAVREVAAQRAIVLTGSGSAFSAGADLRRIIDIGRPYVEEFLPALAETFQTIFDHPGPTVAAVNGHAIAGGCVMAAACDLRIMSGGTIAMSELNVGVPFPTVAIEIMRHAVGPSLGRLVFTAASFDPTQALSIGLVDRVEPPDALLDVAVGEARRMAAIPAEVFAFTKRQLHQPARDRIAARGDDGAVVDMWSSTPTRDAIVGYLDTLRKPAMTRP